ncbi:MAG: diacylglycerol kinase [Aerococcus sp.]|nr:diacylglycerol kinase [Aerococcus sp.]
MGSPEKRKGASEQKTTYKHAHWLDAMRDAIAGLGYAWANERNLRIESILAVLALPVFWWLDLTCNEWLVMIACMGAVFAAELLNSLLEAVVDLVVGAHYDLRAKHIKDMAAGLVVVVCVTVVIIGGLVLFPHLIELIGG